jgi:light-regulated signal transduction histidine kinase (bacteriophytochrome)
MGQLIDDLLVFARLGRTEMRFMRVNLTSLVEEVRHALEPETRDRAVTWKVAALPEVKGDRALLRQVFANLLSNALKYSRHKGETVIEVGVFKQEDGEMVLFVRDNGAGFDMKYAAKLFRVFQRLHSTAEFEGTGVGLAIVRRVIQRHGGKIWAEGKIDEGATFYFTVSSENSGSAQALPT